MLEQKKQIKVLLKQGKVDEAIVFVSGLLNSDCTNKDKLYYIRGNLYRKNTDWHKAMNDYQRAIDLNPDTPAVGAREALLNILNFYNKDMYNQ